MIKYFKYTHLSNHWYRKCGAKLLVVPQTVRWSTMFDKHLESFLDKKSKTVTIIYFYNNFIRGNFLLVLDLSSPKLHNHLDTEKASKLTFMYNKKYQNVNLCLNLPSKIDIYRFVVLHWKDCHIYIENFEQIIKQL